jgi:hypothetical protein
MSRLTKVTYAGKTYPVVFKQTRKWSHTTMTKRGLVWHVTTSNNYLGGFNWLVDGFDPAKGTFGNGGSAMFIVGKEPGEIAMMGELNQMQWHAGNINKPSAKFKKIADKNPNAKSGYTNPNLYLDGVEFVGGVDNDHSGKVEAGEINLTEWQYECAVQIAAWHAEANQYPITSDSHLIHQDVDAGKPDLSNVYDELNFRLTKKSVPDHTSCVDLQKQVLTQQQALNQLFAIIKTLFAMLLKK